MISLESGKTYRLIPVSNSLEGDGQGDGKLYFHIKFTDSSFKAIEEYASRTLQAKKALGPNTNLSIDFNETGDQGHFDVPTSGGSDAKSGGSNVRRFQFSIAPTTLDSGSASFECFQQRKMSEYLTAFGQFAKRLTVKAQEDVFDATRERMAAVVEESEKNRAREITSSNALKPGRRANSLGHGSSSTGVSRSNTMGVAAKATDAASLFDAASLAKRKAAERLASALHHGESKGGGSSTTSKAPAHSLRERVLYALAIKPQAESQLIASLRLSQREQVELGSILKHLCFAPNHNSSVSGNSVNYLRHEAFNDVKFNHPLVTSHEDKMAIRRNAAGSVSGHSSQKPHRPAPISQNDAGSAPATKQRRIDDGSSVPSRHSTKPSGVVASSGRTRPTPAATGSSQNSRLSNGHVLHGTVMRGKTSSNSNLSSNTSPNKDSLDNSVDYGRHSSSSSGNNSRTSNNFGQNATMSSASCSPDLSSSPLVIANREQRAAVKSDFMAKYEEYRKLHDSLSEKTAYFRNMRPQLDQFAPDSDEYRHLEDSIRDAYNKLQEDPSYMASKRKLDELHLTLARIKRAIEDFDVAHAPLGGAAAGGSGGSQPPSASSTSSSPAITSVSSAI